MNLMWPRRGVLAHSAPGQNRPLRRWVRLVGASLAWLTSWTLFGWGFGIAFLGDPAPWKGAVAFACWGASSILAIIALRLADWIVGREKGD